MQRRDFLAVALGATLLPTRVHGAQPASHALLRVALIGHTGHGDYGHGVDLVWAAIPRTTVVAVADADVSGLAAARSRLGGVPGFPDYRTMLSELRPEVVAVCPRHAHEHRDMMVAAIDAGARALYVEKPFTRTCAEADEVIARARSRGVTLTVAYRNRPHPALPVLKRYLDGGALGDVLEIRARGKEDQRGGGQDLWVLGGHLFDIATLFTGPAIACTAGVYHAGRPATPADVHEGAEGVGPIVGDEIHARFDTSSGVPIFYDSKKGAGAAAAGFGMQIVCARGLVDLRMDTDPLVHLQQGSPFQPTTGPRAWVPLTSAGLGTPEPVAGLSKRLLGHVAGVEDLLDAMRTGREPLCGPTSALRTIEMTQSVFASFAAGTRVTLPLAQRTTPLRREQATGLQPTVAKSCFS